MSGRSIRIYQELDGPVTAIQAPKSVTVLVGYGRGAYVGEVRGPYQSLSECAGEMDNIAGGTPDLLFEGHSAIYRWVKNFMTNGARKIYVIETAVTALQTITMTGNGTKRSFDLITDKTGGAGVLTLSPIPGSLRIEHPLATHLVEGTDYIVDWSQGIVYFKTAPAAAANNIQASWKEYTAVNVATSLVIAESVPATIACGAYMASDNAAYSLISALRDHGTNMYTKNAPRGIMLEGYYKDVAAISALAYNNDWCAAFANRSGYFNDNLVNPSTTWKEFIDPTSVVAGIAAARNPWVSLHDKIGIDINQVDDFTSTNMTTMAAAFVNWFQSDGLGNFRLKNGWNFETASATYRFWDSMQLWIYVANSVYADLENANIIGNIQIERDQLSTAKQMMYQTLKRLSDERAIGNPDELYATFKVHPINSMLFDAIEKDVSDRTPAEIAYIQAAQASRGESVRMYYDDQGWLHYLNIYLGGR